MSKDLTMDTWLAEIEKLQQRKVDGLTVSEIADATGYSKPRIQDALRAGIAADRVVFVGRKPITRIDGVVNTSPAYRFIGKAKP